MEVRPSDDGGRGLTRSAVATWLFFMIAALVLAGCGGQPPAGQQTPRDSAAPVPVAPAAQADEQVADPVRVRVPAVGIDAAVGPLFVDDNGVLPPPESFDATGWWHDGPEPGEAGPAVIAGHVDSYRGPAVFFHLDDITTGDKIFVDRADGSTVTFVAHRTERHPKDEFPTEAVYGDTSQTALRLITCGGDFDDEDRRYLDNIIVYATRNAG